jgi:hypothetical protein
LEIDTTDIQKDLINLSKNLLKSSNNANFRDIKQIQSLIVGICKLKNKTKATKEDLFEAIELLKFCFNSMGANSLDNYKKQFNEVVKDE